MPARIYGCQVVKSVELGQLLVNDGSLGGSEEYIDQLDRDQ